MIYFFTLVLFFSALWSSHAAIALMLGVMLSYLFKIPDNYITKLYGPKLLQTGIVFLGGSIGIDTVIGLSGSYMPWISLFVIGTFVLGIILGRLLGVERKQAYLLASGTAICGGTAISAVAPAIRATPEDLTTTLSIIFILNAIAVLTFPVVGFWLQLSQEEFGVWASLAIHDTSSVIGAASIIGFDAVEVAATLKLARTLWIIPLVIFSAWLFRSENKSFGLPPFVIFFILAVCFNSYFSPSEEVTNFLKVINKTFLLAGLFCIGTQIDKKALKKISLRPIILSLGLWLAIVPTSLWLVLSF
mgnify:FL=1|jgi:uncharacterized integral membrane protein (TIGR00698 family)|tara:strand:- start:5231 stop:6139 length:909 start_codon:yes stop_codon:yes gene_type:complete